MLKTRRTALSVNNACLAYGPLHALRGASFELFEGELLGLLGPNGAGKSTLLRCLSGRKLLDAGGIQCLLDGAYRELVGVVPQEIALYQDLSVWQNLKAFAQFQGLATSEQRSMCDWALEWARLREKSRALVRTLSGGMQRRLNMACSVLHRPKILLLDEPTVGVDPQSRERIFEMLESLRDDGTAILLATHNLEEAQIHCDRIAIIDHGRIIETGTFDELLERTIGTSQQMHIRFSAAQTSVPAPLQLDASGRQALGEIQNAATQLPALMAALEEAHVPIEHVDLRSPTLQHMFLHLTGKELRE